jgi:hypothetical protein
MRPLSNGSRLISKATFSRLAIFGFLAQAALLKLTCSADTAIFGKNSKFHESFTNVHA